MLLNSHKVRILYINKKIPTKFLSRVWEQIKRRSSFQVLPTVDNQKKSTGATRELNHPAFQSIRVVVVSSYIKLFIFQISSKMIQHSLLIMIVLNLLRRKWILLNSIAYYKTILTDFMVIGHKIDIFSKFFKINTLNIYYRLKTLQEYNNKQQ